MKYQILFCRKNINSLPVAEFALSMVSVTKAIQKIQYYICNDKYLTVNA